MHFDQKTLFEGGILPDFLQLVCAINAASELSARTIRQCARHI